MKNSSLPSHDELIHEGNILPTAPVPDDFEEGLMHRLTFATLPSPTELADPAKDILEEFEYGVYTRILLRSLPSVPVPGDFDEKVFSRIAAQEGQEDKTVELNAHRLVSDE